MIEGRFAELIAGQRQGVLVTLRQDGWPQLSNVNYAWYPEEQTIRISTTDDRAKTSNMRRDPRVSFHVTTGDFWSYVVADGRAELSAVARDPHDAAVEELVELYRAVQGDHPDWDDYRAAMVRDRRLVVRLRAERAYGMVHRGYRTARGGCAGQNLASALLTGGAMSTNRSLLSRVSWDDAA